jgi:hypothetical protein
VEATFQLACDPEMAAKTYRAMVKVTDNTSGGALLHLIRDDNESSLCGIPRLSLDRAGSLDQVVCGDCIEWLPKRAQASAIYPTLKPSK